MVPVYPPVHPADGGRLPADGTVLLRSRHGPLLTDAIQRYDLNVVQTLVILYAVLGIVGVFLGDVLMMVVDPRITLTGKEEAR